MKILFWADGFWPRIGGTETQGLQFIEALIEKGHSCIVLAQRDELMQEEEMYRGVIIRRFDFNALIAHRELKDIRRMKEHLEWIVEEFQPDILYLNTLANGSALAFLLFRNMFPIPVILTVHAPYYGDGIPLSVQQICSKVDQICCTSQWGLSVMEQVLPLYRNKLKMMYYGLSMPDISPFPLPFSPPTILLLGRLSSEKGFDTAIEAFFLLRKQNYPARLLIAGEGPERRFLEHLVDRWGLRGSVQFTGRLSREGNAVYRIINQSTFVVMPSHFEAFGLVALEAMQMQRPVIASRVGGLPEIISDAERGLLVPSKNPVELCKAMKRLLDNPEETLKMGAQARMWAEKTFLLQESIDQYEHLFEECSHVFR